MFDMVNHRSHAPVGESWRECCWDGETREGAERPNKAVKGTTAAV